MGASNFFQSSFKSVLICVAIGPGIDCMSIVWVKKIVTKSGDKNYLVTPKSYLHPINIGLGWKLRKVDYTGSQFPRRTLSISLATQTYTNTIIIVRELG